MSDEHPPELLAVMRTDVVGSTPYQLRVGDDVAVPSLANHLGQINAIAAAHRGKVVNRQGDGLCAVFPSVSAAIRAAQEVQASSDRRSTWSNEDGFTLRIGVAAGEMVMNDLEAAGRPMIEAERLQTAAEPGQILCSASAAAMTGGRLDADLQPAGERSLKGYSNPVEVVTVAWSALANPLAVLAPTFEREPSTRFVGRAAQTERLEHLWQRATRGEPGLVFIEGEAGVGKSRLARELAVTAHGHGAATLYVPCYADDEEPYGSLSRGLEHYVPRLRGQSYLLGPNAGDLAPLMPEITDFFPDLVLSVPEDISSAERSSVQRAVHGWLRTATADEPMLVVVEDIQWADDRTLSVLANLAHSLEHERLLVVATARPLVDDETTGPLRQLQRHDLSTVLRLDGLDRPDTVALVAIIAGHSMEEQPETAFADRVWRQTDGNPFFVQALLRSLAARGELRLVDGRWTATGDLADAVSRSQIRETIRGQLVGVDEEGLELLRIAAVLGSEFTLSMLHRIADRRDIRDLGVVDKAMRAHMLVELPDRLDTYRFSHDIVRSTFESEVDPEERARIHELAARVVIENAGSADAADPAVLSRHLAQSLDPEARAEAAIYAATAGHRASRADAYEQASALYARALRLMDDPAVTADDRVRADALLGAGLAAQKAGDPSAVEWLRRAVDAAEVLQDGALMARAALVRNRGMFSTLGGVDYQLVEALERSLVLMDDRPSTLRSATLAALGAELTWAGDRDYQESVLAEAETMAVALEDAKKQETVENLCKVLVLKGNSIWRPGTLSERLELSEVLEAKTTGLAIPGWRFAAASLGFQASMEAGLFARADLRLGRMERLADRLNEPIVHWFVNIRRAARWATSGQLEDAKAASEEAFAIGDEAWDSNESQLYYFGSQWIIHYHLGQLEALAEPFSLAAELPNARPVLRPALAAIHAETGDLDACRTQLEQVDESAFAGDDHDLLVTAAVTAIAARAVGDRTRANMAYQTLIPYEGQMIDNASTHFGDVDHYLALAAATVGDHAEAIDRLKKATEKHRRLGADPLTARSRVEAERLRVETQDDADADRALSVLEQLAAECTNRGFGGAANAARAVLGH